MGRAGQILGGMAAIALCLLSLAWPTTLQASSSMRCGSRLVGEGDYIAELLAACGEPSFRDEWQYPARYGGGLVSDTEVWTYDLGPNQLLRVVRLRDGKISDIATDGYGFSTGYAGRCDPSAIIEGLSKYRLFRKCGEPLTRRAENLLLPLSGQSNIYRNGNAPYADRNQYVIPTYREEWVYNFGSRTALRRVIIENGWISNVEQLDRGYDAR